MAAHQAPPSLGFSTQEHWGGLPFPSPVHPIFTDAKVVLSLYNESLDAVFSPNIVDKAAVEGVAPKDVEVLAEPTGINLAKLAIQYADGIIAGVPELDSRLAACVKEHKLPLMSYVKVDKDDNSYVPAYSEFYDNLLKKTK